MTKRQVEEAYKDTVAYKAHESAIKAVEAAYRARAAAEEVLTASLLTKFETMWALGATEEYKAWEDATRD